jgi:hypothetical protein
VSASEGGFLTCEISHVLVRAVVFAPGWVVPFHAEPVSGGTADRANVPNGAERCIVGKALADTKLGVYRHVGSFLLWYLEEHGGANEG